MLITGALADGPLVTPVPWKSPGENWNAINQVLRHGHRGLPHGLSIPQLLAEWRGVRNISSLPRLSVQQILAWADNTRSGMDSGRGSTRDL